MAVDWSRILHSRLFLAMSAIFTRVLFILHELCVVWYAYTRKDRDGVWWLLMLLAVPVVVELIVVVVVNKGYEWSSYFLTAFFLYLIGVIPQLWIVELDRVRDVQQGLSLKNLTTTFSIDFFGLGNPLEMTLTNDVWTMALEQALLYILIFARWLLPMRNIKYDELTNYLLLFIGMAADTTELMDLFEHRTAIDDWRFVYGLLVVYSMSLFQFTYALSSSEMTDGSETSEDCRKNTRRNEILSNCLSMLLMTIPFSIIRFVAIFVYNGRAYSSWFFLLKNLFMTLFRLFRVIVLLCEQPKPTKPTECATPVEEIRERGEQDSHNNTAFREE